jgi:hypothetical protein
MGGRLFSQHARLSVGSWRGDGGGAALPLRSLATAIAFTMSAKSEVRGVLRLAFAGMTGVTPARS